MRTILKHSQLKKPPAGESGSASCSPLPDPGTVNSDPAGASYMTYQEQIKSPKWQKKRLEILERDRYTCQCCLENEKTLHVHHLFYLRNIKIYEYPDNFYITLCEDCHSITHEETEKLYISIVEHYSNELNNGGNSLICYIKALRVAVKISEYHIGAFTDRAEYWDKIPF